MRKDSILNIIFPICEHNITAFLLTEISALKIHATVWFRLGIITFECVDPVQARLNWLQFSRSVMSDSLRPHGLYSSPASSVHGLLQARISEWVAISPSRESSQSRD